MNPSIAYLLGRDGRYLSAKIDIILVISKLFTFFFGKSNKKHVPE